MGRNGRGRSGEYALQTLRAAILEGRYGPSERISQEQLADEMALSRSPVREALRQLDREGLVRIIPNAGAEVVGVDPLKLVDIYRLREKLDPIALGDSIERTSLEENEELVLQLGAYCDEMEGLGESETGRFEELDRKFHVESRFAVSLIQFRDLLDGLWNMTVLGRNQYWQMGSSHAITNLEHRLILDAIQRRDSTDAMVYLEAHIKRTRLAIAEWARNNSLKSRKRKLAVSDSVTQSRKAALNPGGGMK